MKKSTALVLTAILLLGILFPFATMTRFFSGYALVFNQVFQTMASHILMHAFLFGALCGLFQILLRARPKKQKIQLSLAGVLLAAVGQETLQMVTTQTSDFSAAFFDLGVDLGGALLVIVISLLIDRLKIKN